MCKFAAIAVLTSFLIPACGRITDSPEGCVTAFISSVLEHNMSKSWSLLGTEAQDYYNEIGRKTRRSGKGALESEIKRIKKFRTIKEDYIIHKDSTDNQIVRMVLTGGGEFRIETVNENGIYKLRDAASVENLLKGITMEAEKKELY